MEIPRVISERDILFQALEAHNYFWPRRKPHGGGSAMGLASCGHLESVGAPCCRKCAIERIEKGLKLIKVK